MLRWSTHRIILNAERWLVSTKDGSCDQVKTYFLENALFHVEHSCQYFQMDFPDYNRGSDIFQVNRSKGNINRLVPRGTLFSFYYFFRSKFFDVHNFW